MSLQSRLATLINAIGADIKSLSNQVATLQPLDADLTSLAGFPSAGNAGKAIRVKTDGSGYDIVTPSIATNIYNVGAGAYPTRPNADVVIWMGSVDPAGASVNNDLWVNTT